MAKKNESEEPAEVVTSVDAEMLDGDREKVIEKAAAETAKAEAAEETREPNIIFVRRRQRFVDGESVTEEAEAPSFIMLPTADGPQKLKLPDTATQRKGFYHERANEIIGAFPDVYKDPNRLKKGE